MKRPIVRWHGGKWRIAPWIIEHIPPHRIYVEPFGGAGSVLLRKPKSHTEVLNDINSRIISAFRIIRDRPEELARLLRFTPCSEEEYQACREISEDPVEDARRILVLGHQSHGSTGACSDGKRSGWRRGVRPEGQDSAQEWKDIWQHVTRWSDRLRGVYLESDDGIEVIRRWDGPDVVFYIDPPYLMYTRGKTANKNGYGKFETGDRFHSDLANVLRQCKGMILLSGYRSSAYERLYADWTRVERSAWADGGSPRTECLWISPSALTIGNLFEA